MTIAKAIRRRRSKKVGSVRMSLLNLSKRTDTEVWQAIRHAVSGLTLKQHPNIRVTVTGSSGWHGRYLANGSEWGDDTTPVVVANVTADEAKFPQSYEPHRQGYLPHLILDSTECLIGLLAHEFCHAWQHEHKCNRKGWRRKVWGARGIYSERECDAYAMRQIRKYRRSCPERLQKYDQKVAEVVENLLPSRIFMNI